MSSTTDILLKLAPNFVRLDYLERQGTPKPWKWDNKIEVSESETDPFTDELYTHVYLPECSWLTGAISYASDNDENGGMDALFLEEVTAEIRPLLDAYAQKCLDYEFAVQEMEYYKALYEEITGPQGSVIGVN